MLRFIKRLEVVVTGLVVLLFFILAIDGIFALFGMRGIFFSLELSIIAAFGVTATILSISLIYKKIIELLG